MPNYRGNKKAINGRAFIFYIVKTSPLTPRERDDPIEAFRRSERENRIVFLPSGASNPGAEYLICRSNPPGMCEALENNRAFPLCLFTYRRRPLVCGKNSGQEGARCSVEMGGKNMARVGRKKGRRLTEIFTRYVRANVAALICFGFAGIEFFLDWILNFGDFSYYFCLVSFDIYATYTVVYSFLSIKFQN